MYLLKKKNLYCDYCVRPCLVKKISFFVNKSLKTDNINQISIKLLVVMTIALGQKHFTSQKIKLGYSLKVVIHTN
jgi:hypothetical protein